MVEFEKFHVQSLNPTSAYMLEKRAGGEGEAKIGGWVAIVGRRGLLCIMYICDDIYT